MTWRCASSARRASGVSRSSSSSSTLLADMDVTISATRRSEVRGRKASSRRSMRHLSHQLCHPPCCHRRRPVRRLAPPPPLPPLAPLSRAVQLSRRAAALRPCRVVRTVAVCHLLAAAARQASLARAVLTRQIRRSAPCTLTTPLAKLISQHTTTTASTFDSTARPTGDAAFWPRALSRRRPRRTFR